MAQHPNDLTTDEDIDAAIAEAELHAHEPVIAEAVYHPGPGFDFLMLKLSDGRRLLVPREELSELKNATVEQSTDLFVDALGYFVWWPQLEDGLYLPDFLEHRWHKVEQREIAA